VRWCNKPWFARSTDFATNTTQLSISIAAKQVNFIHVKFQRFDRKNRGLTSSQPLESPSSRSGFKKKRGLERVPPKGLGRTHSALAEVGVAVEVARPPLGGNWAALQGEGGGSMQLPLVRQEERAQALVPDLKLILVLADLRGRHKKVGMPIVDGSNEEQGG
jgi:hypothetical protein